MEKAYLILQDGTVFEGNRLGVSGTVMAELAFTADVVGYMETLSNTRYIGKIVVQTFPLIGNYGAISEEAGGTAPFVSGYIVREICDKPSNFRMEGTLQSYLEQQGVIGISGIDVRALKRRNREGGMLALIAPDKSNLEDKLKQLRDAAKAAKSRGKGGKN